MSAIAKNNVFYGAVEPIPINDGSTSATETWSGQYLNQERTAINSKLVPKLLGTITSAGQTVNLAEELSHFNNLRLVSYYQDFILNTVDIPVSVAIGHKAIVNFNDGTIRKAQIDSITNNTIKAGSNFTNVTSVEIYGVS